MSGGFQSDSNDSHQAFSVMTGGSSDSSRGSDDESRYAEMQRRDSLQQAVLQRGGPQGSTESTHTLPRPREPSVTVTGRSSSPSDTPLEQRNSAGTSGVRLSFGSTAARFAVSNGTPPLSAESSAPVAAAEYNVRDTAEYRAAWDLELWKAVQADRFRRALEEQKSIAFADLKRLVKQRGRAAQMELRQRAAAVTLREEAVQAEETRLAERQQRVADMEKDLRRMRQQLLDAQQRVEDEVRVQVRLANETIAHRARLLEERVRAAEAQARRADERQRQAQQEYLSLYEAFSRYRTQQLTSSSSAGGGRDSINAGGGAAYSSLQIEQLRVQWEAEHQLKLDRQAQQHAADMAASQQRCRELEEQNRRLAAALARRREKLRRHAEDAVQPLIPASASQRPPLQGGCADREKLSGSVTAALPLFTPSPAVGAATAVALQPMHNTPALFDLVKRTSRELHRLETERLSLVEGSSGALRETDAVILRIDARILELRERLTAASSTT
ncbi:hypothetical protein LSCM1_05493 [Leishmania martiniquensis]|uniref:Uncharacterized protein n=1 Tax=Leishmania martiniquensis TaxID=1580590 RepID=A0A836KP08_9TRYP|nr:hypothetical protein LSCM1_05493 [Leishmania martiniquensis]